MNGHHLKRLKALNHPAVPLADAGRLHAEEGVRHAAPQHGHDGLHVQTRRALWHRVFVLALEYGRGERHRILQSREKNNKSCVFENICMPMIVCLMLLMLSFDQSFILMNNKN